MPTYEFRCQCGHQFDKFSFSEDGLEYAICPECNGLAGRIMSLTNHFWKNGQKP